MKNFYIIVAAVFAILTASCAGKGSGADSGEDTVTEIKQVAEAAAQTEEGKSSEEKSEKNTSAAEDVVLTQMVSNGKPSVIDFSATWCGPCKMMAPIFHKLASKYADKYNFITIDIDENRELAEKYHIQAVPTFVFIDADGEEGDRIKGAVKESELEDMLKNPAWF